LISLIKFDVSFGKNDKVSLKFLRIFAQSHQHICNPKVGVLCFTCSIE